MTNAARVGTPFRGVSTDTPFQAVSSLVHFVTQWMSTVTSSAGRAMSSCHDHASGLSTCPLTVKRHLSSGMFGVGPADRTGEPRGPYWPGGGGRASAPH